MFQDEHLTNIHKKAIIGNLIKKYCGKFYTEYNENFTQSTIVMPMMNFSQSPFIPRIPNFMPLTHRMDYFINQILQYFNPNNPTNLNLT